MNYSIVITTFDKRFEAFFKPLLLSIKQLRPNVEVIVMVNGPAKAEFDSAFRSSVLELMASTQTVYPTMFPNFQSLAKLWNRGVLTSSNDRVLILNDDLGIDPHVENSFFDQFEAVLNSIPNKTFTINGSFSHFVVSKEELTKVGFFDERLLGLGEEDWDLYWRYHETFDNEIPSFEIGNIDNVHSDITDGGYTKGIRTASKFNRDFIKTKKYQDIWFGGYKGMFDKRVKKILPDENQYPYENFYQANKDSL